eukprot:TRINITY_DN16565_c1_g1_i1.p1 TRINITY_DN16565_c1_g1~~TRINITY_DN16565_c1_g1_i1.p1  ORF type:complete len:554 (+),score=188.13 TRINITY_DN16565_c1_g1_i1:70-1662(+)
MAADVAADGAAGVARAGASPSRSPAAPVGDIAAVAAGVTEADVRVLLARQRLQRHYGPATASTAADPAPLAAEDGQALDWDGDAVRRMIEATQLRVTIARESMRVAGGEGRRSPPSVLPPLQEEETVSPSHGRLQVRLRLEARLRQMQQRAQDAEARADMVAGQLLQLIDRDHEICRLIELQNSQIDIEQKRSAAAEERASAAESTAQALAEELAGAQRLLSLQLDETDNTAEALRSAADEKSAAQRHFQAAEERAAAARQACVTLQEQLGEVREANGALKRDNELLQQQVRKAEASALAMHESAAARLGAAAAASRDGADEAERLRRELSVVGARCAEKDATIAQLRQQLLLSEERIRACRAAQDEQCEAAESRGAAAGEARLRQLEQRIAGTEEALAEATREAAQQGARARALQRQLEEEAELAARAPRVEAPAPQVRPPSPPPGLGPRSAVSPPRVTPPEGGPPSTGTAPPPPPSAASTAPPPPPPTVGPPRALPGAVPRQQNGMSAERLLAERLRQLELQLGIAAR